MTKYGNVGTRSLVALAGLASLAGSAAAQGLIASQGVIVATDGDPIPNANGVPIPNFTFGNSGALGNNCVLDPDGNVFFMGRLLDSGGSTTASNDKALFRGTSRADLRMVIRGEDQAPTLSPGVLLRTGTQFSSALGSNVRLTPNGQLLWGSTFFDTVGTANPPVVSTNDEAFFGGYPGFQGVLVRQGDNAPGTVGAIFAQTLSNPNYATQGMNREGRVYLSGTLQGGDTTTTTGMNNQAGLWSGLPGALEMVVRRSTPASGLPGTYVIDTTTSAVNYAQMNDAGQLLYDLALSTTQGTSPAVISNDRALMVHTPGAGSQKIVREGDTAPSTSGATFNAVTGDAWQPIVSVNAWTRSAQTVFVSELRGGDVVGTTNERAMFLGGTGGLTQVVRKGQPAAGTDGNFSAFNTSTSNATNPILNASGQICFIATIAGGTVTTTNDTGIWAGTPGALNLVIREGTVMPGTGGSLAGNFATTGAVYYNDLGQVLFNVSLAGGTVTGTSLWAWDPIGGLYPMVLNGDQVQYAPGLFRTVNGFGTVGNANGDGAALVFGHDGKVGLRVGFTGSLNAIMIGQVPHPCITPTVTAQPAATGVCAGSIARFSVGVAHSTAVTYQWSRNTLPLTDGGNISGATTAVLTINPALAADAGFYECVATTSCGTTMSAPAVLSVDSTDTDGDGTADCNDGCPNDPLKIAPGICGCGVADADTDLDGTVDCLDGCPNDPLKTAPGTCGCGVAEVDTDHDGVLDCQDGCPNDIDKVEPGQCGCGVPDNDTDLDGTADCIDGCPSDPLKIAPGTCGCGVADTDSDGDMTPDCFDGCPLDAFKIAPGQCGCGVADTDSDLDGTADCNDGCPSDPLKIAPGACGCGVADTDSDLDGTADCNDGCPSDPLKVAPGACGCGVVDTDSDLDGTADCNDGCPNDPLKIAPGVCGCGVADTDSDLDGTADCFDGCPNDPLKIAPGVCGCGVVDTDSDLDGTADCNDLCPSDPAKIAPGACGCGVADTDSDLDGTADCNDGCPSDPLKTAPGQCGCGVVETDGDLDGVSDCVDNCDTVANAGQADVDMDGVGDACDNCPQVANAAQGDCNGDQQGDACEIANGVPDCNGNGVPDTCDIAALTSGDLNNNTVPDECETNGGTPYCFGYSGCPCGNDAAPGSNQGCANSTGQGALLLGSGVSSLGADSLVLTVSNLPIPGGGGPGYALFFQGDAQTNVPFQDGRRCVAGSQVRLGTLSGTTGTLSYPQVGGLPISTVASISGPGARFYQVWYRNNLGPCHTGSNVSNGLAVIWAP